MGTLQSIVIVTILLTMSVIGIGLFVGDVSSNYQSESTILADATNFTKNSSSWNQQIAEASNEWKEEIEEPPAQRSIIDQVADQVTSLVAGGFNAVIQIIESIDILGQIIGDVTTAPELQELGLHWVIGGIMLLIGVLITFAVLSVFLKWVL